MTVQTQLQFKEYRNLLFTLTYRKPVNIVFLVIGIFLLLIALLGMTTSLLMSKTMTNDYTMVIIWGGLMVFMFPYAVYRQAKRNYFTDARLRELITYQFTQEALMVQGESFSSTLSWNKLYKAVEMKNWILLYQNHLVANLIPKRVLDEEQLHSLRTILKAQPSLKKKLQA